MHCKGPLVLEHTVVGVVKGSAGCASSYPDLYTNVYEYRRWIENEMEKTMLSDQNSGKSSE